MLRSRIIPCLLMKQGALVKTTQFDNPKYVGDPLNTVRILNEKMVDELIIVDIDATVSGNAPDFLMIGNIAAECRMPLCYAGGIKSIEHIERIISLGVEKVALGSAAVETPELISVAAKRLGTQSVVVVLDVKKSAAGDSYEVFTHNGKKATGRELSDVAMTAASLGAGEILINSVENDGVMCGYDYRVVSAVKSTVNLPLTVLGGARGISDCFELFRRFGVIGAAAGSIFVFKGKFRAVLIQYPSDDEKREGFEKLASEMCAV